MGGKPIEKANEIQKVMEPYMLPVNWSKSDSSKFDSFGTTLVERKPLLVLNFLVEASEKRAEIIDECRDKFPAIGRYEKLQKKLTEVEAKIEKTYAQKEKEIVGPDVVLGKISPLIAEKIAAKQKKNADPYVVLGKIGPLIAEREDILIEMKGLRLVVRPINFGIFINCACNSQI